MESHSIEVRDDLVDGLWGRAREAFGENGLDEDVLVVEEKHPED